MNKTTIIVIAVIAVLIIGGIFYFTSQQPRIETQQPAPQQPQTQQCEFESDSQGFAEMDFAAIYIE